MLAGLAIVVAGVGVTTAGPAAAAPTGANDAGLTPVTLVCGGVTYQTVTNGQGKFTPAHDVATNAVFVPSQFGAATIVVTDPEGNVLNSFVDAAIENRGSSVGRQPGLLDCTYALTFQVPDPDFGYVTISVTGVVSGYRPRG